MVYAFMVFMVLKTLAFDFSFYGYVQRYKKTYGTWNQVEIWLLVLATVKLTILLPNYFYKGINYLFISMRLTHCALFGSATSSTCVAASLGMLHPAQLEATWHFSYQKS